MKLDPILSKATRLAVRGKYGAAIETLEREVFRYHDSFWYYYILGAACLYSGDFGGAFTYFKRARELKIRNPLALLGMAALFLRRGETDRALDMYLEVQELDGRDKTVRRALRVIRKYGGAEALSAWIDAGKLPRLYPPFPALPPRWNRVLIPAAGVLAALILCGGILLRAHIISPPAWLAAGKGEQREGLSVTGLEREDRDSPVQIGGTYRYILTRNQVLHSYDEARSFFSEKRDEAVKVALNRILESNASEGIKNKARILRSYTEPPGFDTLRDRYRYADVRDDPILYRDCYVIWRGMATNIEEPEPGVTTLDFLVGYDTRNTMEGIVRVRFDFSVGINPERPLEILGRIVPVVSEGRDDIELAGTAVHQAGFLENGRP